MAAPSRQPRPRWRSIRRWIILSQVALCLAGGALVLHLTSQGPRPPFLSGAAPAPAPPLGEDGMIHLAGSGSNLPLTRALVQGLGLAARGDAGEPLVVHPSIGSTGAIRAVTDGTIHLGLISRPLNPRERGLGLTVIPYARVAVIVAANKSGGDDGLTRQDLLEIYRGRRPRWPDGRRLTVILRERGDSSHQAVERVIPSFARITERALRRERWPVAYHDHGMQEALLSTPGAVGLFDLGAVVSQGLPLKVLALDGVAPTVEALDQGRYPLFKDLAFVCRGAPRGSVAHLLALVFSPAGRDLIRAKGYLPLAREARGRGSERRPR